MRGILSLEPSDLVDLLLDLETLQVVELGLVALSAFITRDIIPLRSHLQMILNAKLLQNEKLETSCNIRNDRTLSSLKGRVHIVLSPSRPAIFGL